MSKEVKTSFEIAPGKTLEIGAGKLGLLANGSCTVRLGDTILFVAVCSAAPRPGTDFLPLQLDYREKFSSAGKFPGGFIKREGRPSDKEILTCRLADRPIRPLFPKGFFDEIQIQGLTLSSDGQNDPDVLLMVGASTALMLSDLPFQGPIGAVRVGCVNGELIANPTHAEMAKSTLELVYAGLPDQVIMIEGEASEVSEELLEKAMRFANEIVKVQCAAQVELAKQIGRPKKTPNLNVIPQAILDAVKAFCAPRLEEASLIPGKEARQAALNTILSDFKTSVAGQFAEIADGDLQIFFARAFDDLVQETVRHAILVKGYRPDGRGANDLRPISCEAGVLPIVHGSGLFARGETQALVIATLGSGDDAQERDPITGGESEKKFYLHYNFPNYSVGEVGRITGPGRREIGHGNLAERSLSKVIPADFPYTVRLVSEVMMSNGSTSMASVCGGTLALMDAGVPITAPVVGISCGLVTDESGKKVILTDILGAEDHFGDMDFKVCGTRKGITGFQLDLKLPGISIDLLAEAMKQNREAREKIHTFITDCIAAPREEIAETAPRYKTVRINPEKIGALIGPGGKNIKEICEVTGSKVDINDDGTVNIFALNGEKLADTVRRVESYTAEAELDKIYRGKVVSVKDFGAFVELFPGCEGLLHISEMADYRVAKVTDICNVGDQVTVKVVDIDRATGKVRLSRKAALAEIG